MLDVHPPHESAHTWSDFLIHIATIVVGLVIAIGLEQTVEFFHHRREVAETREALQRERDANLRAYAQGIGEFYRQTAALTNNLIVLDDLQRHPRTPQQDLPGVLVWHAVRISFADSAWTTAQQSGVTALMPPAEVRRDADLYDRIDGANHGFDAIWPSIIDARLYAMLDPDPAHLSAAALQRELADTRAALVADFTWGAALVQLARVDPGFAPALTPQQLNSLMHVNQIEHDPALARAIALTQARIPGHNLDISPNPANP